MHVNINATQTKSLVTAMKMLWQIKNNIQQNKTDNGGTSLQNETQKTREDKQLRHRQTDRYERNRYDSKKLLKPDLLL